jgi:hypothetical protein
MTVVTQSVYGMSYGSDDRGSIPGRNRGFSLHYHVQTGSGAHSASYPKGSGGSFSGIKWPGREATTHLHLSPWLRMSGPILPLPHTYSGYDS